MARTSSMWSKSQSEVHLRRIGWVIGISSVACCPALAGVALAATSRLAPPAKATRSPQNLLQCVGAKTVDTGATQKTGKSEKVHLDADTNIQGVVYRANSDISFYPTGRIKDGILAGDTRIRDVKWARGPIEYFEDGSVKEGELAENAPFRGMLCGAGERVTFRENGTVEVRGAARDSTQDIPIQIQGTRFVIGPNSSVVFHENGKVKSGFLAGNANIQGMKFLGSVEFYASGALQKGQLATTARIQGMVITAGVVHHWNGTYLVVGGDRELEFYESGKLKVRQWLATDLVSHGIRYKKESPLYFFENGRVQRGTLAANTKIEGTPYESGDEIEFSEDGRIKICGNESQSCCVDERCKDANLYCGNGTCLPCGMEAQPCCPGYGACNGARLYCRSGTCVNSRP